MATTHTAAATLAEIEANRLARMSPILVPFIPPGATGGDNSPDWARKTTRRYLPVIAAVFPGAVRS